MNFIIRKIRRWKYGQRCAACKRKFMFKHACKKFPKTISEAQKEINSITNRRIDAVTIALPSKIDFKTINENVEKVGEELANIHKQWTDKENPHV